MATKASAQISVMDLTDGYTVLLTSESYTFPGSVSAAKAGSCTTQVIAMCGKDQVAASVVLTEITKPSGVTVSKDNDAVSPTLTISVSTAVTAPGTITIPVHVDDLVFTKEFSFGIAFTGATGSPGTSVTITSTSITYQKGTSGTAKPTGTWETSIPSVGQGEYLWTKTVVTYSDGKSTEAYSVSRNATNGTNGTSPTVSSTDVKYQQSTSGTAVPTGTWNTTPPAATAGQYMWTQTTVTYSDGATAVSYGVSRNGSNGTNATAYDLIVSHAAIVKSEAGAYNPTSITLTGKSQTGSAAKANYSGRFKIETTANNSDWTEVYTSSGNEATKTYTVPSGIIAIKCSLYLAGGTSTLLDQQIVPIVNDGAAGADAYTVVLSNESHTFAAGTSAAVAGSTECSIIALKGGTPVAATIGTISGAPTGMSTSISGNGTTSARFTVTVTTAMTTRQGVLTVPVTVDGKSFSMRFSYSLAIQGVQGIQGPQGSAGDDAILLVIESSNGVIFKNTDIVTTLTARVFRGGVEVTGSALTALGTIKWYRDGGSTAVGTGATLSIGAGDVQSIASFVAQLEA